jgi:hypothetical protein
MLRHAGAAKAVGDEIGLCPAVAVDAVGMTFGKPLFVDF